MYLSFHRVINSLDATAEQRTFNLLKLWHELICAVIVFIACEAIKAWLEVKSQVGFVLKVLPQQHSSFLEGVRRILNDAEQPKYLPSMKIKILFQSPKLKTYQRMNILNIINPINMKLSSGLERINQNVQGIIALIVLPINHFYFQ